LATHGLRVGVCRTAVGKMRNCGMETVERCYGTVGKMHNAEICRMWVIVGPQKGIVNFYEWACVVR